MEEIWKDIGIKKYQVSNLGNVKGADGIRLLKPRIKKCGYLEVVIQNDGIKKYKTIHSLVMETFVGERPEGMDIDHINRIKNDNCLGNLRYCSRSENLQNRDDWDKNELHGKEWYNNYQQKYRLINKEKHKAYMKIYNKIK